MFSYIQICMQSVSYICRHVYNMHVYECVPVHAGELVFLYTCRRVSVLVYARCVYKVQVCECVPIHVGVWVFLKMLVCE